MVVLDCVIRLAFTPAFFKALGSKDLSLIHVNGHVTSQELKGLHHGRDLVTILIHLNHMNSLLLIQHQPHLIVLLG